MLVGFPNIVTIYKLLSKLDLITGQTPLIGTFKGVKDENFQSVLFIFSQKIFVISLSFPIVSKIARFNIH